MKSQGMGWIRRAAAGAGLALLATGCHLSRADAWDDKHKQIPALQVQTQLSRGRVAAGETVTVRCAVSQGDEVREDVATTLDVSPKQALTVTVAEHDPHTRTLMPNAHGSYRVTCAAPEAPAGMQVPSDSVTLRVDPAPAVRWQARVQSETVAGTRVAVRCVPVDVFDNLVPTALLRAASTPPGFDMTPDAGVDIDAVSFSARRAGDYTITCRAQGSLSASAPAAVQVLPDAPVSWKHAETRAPLTDADTLREVKDDGDLTPPYALYDRFNNPVPTQWQVERVQEDGSVAPAEATAEPGVYRYTPRIAEFTDATRLTHAAFDMLRNPPAPEVTFDDAFRAHGQHMHNARDIPLKTRVRSMAGVGTVRVRGVAQSVPPRAREVAVEHAIGSGEWGLQNLFVDATNTCGLATQRIQSYIASPRFERPDADATTAAAAWSWSHDTLKEALAQSLRNAWRAAPANLAQDVQYGPPSDGPGRDAWQKKWGRRLGTNHLWAYAKDWLSGQQRDNPADVSLAVQHTGDVSYADVGIDRLTVQADGRVDIDATLSAVQVPGMTRSADGNVPVVLHLDEVYVDISAVVRGDALADIHVRVLPATPGTARLVTAAPAHPDASAPADADTPALHEVPDTLMQALQAAWTPVFTGALGVLQRERISVARQSLSAEVVAQPVTTGATQTQSSVGDTCMHEARVRYTAAPWHHDGRPGAAVHGLAALPPPDPARRGDRLLFSDDGINTLLWSVWAADGFATSRAAGALRELSFALPPVWSPDPSGRPNHAALGVAARVRVEADGHTYDGDVQGSLPLSVVWRDGQLHVALAPAPPDGADPARVYLVLTADHKDESDAFRAAMGRAGFDTWVPARLNRVLRELPQPQLLQTLPPPCRWQPDERGAQRSASGLWTEVYGRAVCATP